jgi:hypothetical protein
LQSLADWKQMPDETRESLKQGLKEALKDRSLEDITRWRDEKLVEILKVIYNANSV